MSPKSVSISLLILIFMPFGAVVAERKNYTEEEDRLKERCVDEIVDMFAKEMYEKYNLSCSGVGGSMPYDIREIGVRFDLKQEVSLEEARELEVRTTERLVEMINASEKIRPYLIEYPWKYDRVDIVISFLQNNGSYCENGISLIFQAKNRLLYYSTKDPNSMGIQIKKEEYIEAKKIVDTSSSCLRPIEKRKKGFLSWLR